MELGKGTAIRRAKEIAAFEKHVKSWPTSYSPESLLRDKIILYRRCHVINRCFRLIYYYGEKDNVVHVVDIWEAKMNPKTLIRKIR